MAESVQMTPMLRHYSEVKAQNPEAVVLYRMGDFYEVFFDDARLVAPILEVTLTARHKGRDSEVPMCGVPHHALEVYLGKLIRAGMKVAICDQVEDPARAKGLVKREVTRVVTPGTVSEPDLLESKEENFLVATVWKAEGGGSGAFLDVSTGSFFARRWADEESALQDLQVLQPREVVFEESRQLDWLTSWAERNGVCKTLVGEEEWFDSRKARSVLERHFRVATLRGFGVGKGEETTIGAAALALSYARETQRTELSHVHSFSVRHAGDRLVLDSTTLANLEIFRALRAGTRGGTLISVVDRTSTPPGARLLREWLRRPLRSQAEIAARHDAVEELLSEERRRGRLRDRLRSIGDPARLLSRAVLGSLTPRDAAALREALRVAPGILSDLEGCRSEILEGISREDPLADLAKELERVLEEEPAANLARGGVIAEGVDEELDRIRSLARDSKKHLLKMERDEREATGIASLKIRYNKVFGYYVEVTKANEAVVPRHYVRKQTLVNAERFITPELKELEEQILSAEERQLVLEKEHFESLRARIVDESARLDRLVGALAVLDALTNFAEIAARHDFRRPEMLTPGNRIEIEGGRHPVVERMGGEFVPNDTLLDVDRGDIVVLTGPNMGGKSTYLRQVALIVLLAQSGSFVPARRAEIGVVDRIFTRVGASDDLTRGESTFMVEMIETANILRQAGPESLVVLDEVGRGTATFDGLSIAWATVEHLHEKVKAKTLFATHYHELTELSATLARVVNRTMAVKEWEGQIVFLRRVIPGSADKSYGIHVARLAGLPASVVRRAEEVLGNLESQEYDVTGKPRLARGDGPGGDGPGQLALFASQDEIVARVLRETAVEELTPLAALNLLQTLKSRLGD